MDISSFEYLGEIGEYLAQSSKRYASHVISLILEKVELLNTFPQIGRIVPESNIKSIRELVIKKYRIIYSCTNKKQIDILAVRHSAKPLDDIPVR